MTEPNIQHFTAKIVAIQQKMAKNGKPFNAVEFDNQIKLNFFGPFDAQLMDYLDVGWTPGTNPAYPNGKDVKNWIKVPVPINTGNLGIAPTPSPVQLPIDPVIVNEAKKGHEENIAMHNEEMVAIGGLNKTMVLLNTTLGSLHEEVKNLVSEFHRLFLSPEIEKAAQQISEKKETK